MKQLIIAALLIAGGVAWAELREWLPWIAKRILTQAVSAISINEQERMREELMAELAAIPGKISPLIFASSIWWSFWRTALIARLNVSASQHAVRMLDIALSYLMVILASPMIIISMLAIRLNFRQSAVLAIRCTGRNNQEFLLLRFRTRDPKTGARSSIGLFMWQTGLDRLPELVNVVRGDMSLVGPPPSRHRPSNYTFMNLRPGIVWFQAGSIHDPDSYGRSTFKTMMTYFRLLYAAVMATFFYPEE